MSEIVLQVPDDALQALKKSPDELTGCLGISPSKRQLCEAGSSTP